MRTVSGRVSSTRRTNSKRRSFRGSGIDAPEFRVRSLEKPWQGGQPARRSSLRFPSCAAANSSAPLRFLTSARRTWIEGKLAWYVSAARSLISTATAGRNRARRKPRVIPPIPLKRSTATGHLNVISPKPPPFQCRFARNRCATRSYARPIHSLLRNRTHRSSAWFRAAPSSADCRSAHRSSMPVKRQPRFEASPYSIYPQEGIEQAGSAPALRWTGRGLGATA